MELKFNHEADSISEALGISREKAEIIVKIVRHLLKSSKNHISQVIHKITKKMQRDEEILFAILVLGKMLIIEANPIIADLLDHMEEMRDGDKAMMMIYKEKQTRPKDESFVDELIKKSMEGTDHE